MEIPPFLFLKFGNGSKLKIGSNPINFNKNNKEQHEVFLGVLISIYKNYNIVIKYFIIYVIIFYIIKLRKIIFLYLFLQ